MTSLFTRATISAPDAGLACVWARAFGGSSATLKASVARMKAGAISKVKTDPRLRLFIVCTRCKFCTHDCNWKFGFGRISRGLSVHGSLVKDALSGDFSVIAKKLAIVGQRE